MKASVVLLLLGVTVALCAQADLYPRTADGFDTVWLDDISFANELNFQTWGEDARNITFYVYGQSRIRTVYPATPQRSFYVGSTPNENWHLPFIDFHTFQNGSDIWGLGPINALYARNRTGYSGFQFEIAIITTKYYSDNPRGRFFVEQPLGFEGTFYSTRVVGFDPNNVIAYFCGFFPANNSFPMDLHFGIRRAHFNVSLFSGNQPFNYSAEPWVSDPAKDDVVIYPNAQLVTFNADFKPFVLHARNVSSTAPVNSTWIVVVDPYSNFATLIMGNYDPNVPLVRTAFTYVPVFGSNQYGNIVSAVIWQHLLFVGVAVDGQGTGWIDVLYLANLTKHADSIMLPTNYSDPRALVLDAFDPTGVIYIGMNGGASVLRLNISKLAITGFQTLPYYLHRTWRGQATHEHVYFITNEQHSKVYRMSKFDFCPAQCMEYGYCKNGQCVCGPNLVKQGNRCEWRTVVVEKHIVSKEKGGEIALGIFFAIAVVAAAAGWYMVYKNKRGYQAVA